MSEKVSKLVFPGRETGGLDPLGPEDNMRRIDFYTRIQRKNAIASPAPAFVAGLVFVGLGVWTLLSGSAYLGFGLFSLGIGLFFALVTGIILWREARRRKRKTPS